MDNSSLYTCPMDPDVLKKEPGKCPKCGMELVPLHSEAHTSHTNMEESFKKRFLISLPLTVIILLLSHQIQQWLGLTVDFTGKDTVLFLLATVIVFWAGWSFYQMALGELRSKAPAMMSLVSLAVLAGYFFSVAGIILFPGMSFFWEVSTLVLAFLFGHWMELRAVRGATGALSELAKLIPPTAHLIIKDHQVVDVGTENLKKGDNILIRPGEKVPIDGKVVGGESSVNEAMITGESVPVLKKAGDTLIGGTINGDGSLTVEVTKTGSQTAIAQMMELIRQAQESKPAVQKLADRAASWLFYIALTAGVLTFVYWFFVNPQGAIFASTLAITTIVIACPHALGLAIPTVTTITTALAAKNGILLRDMKAVEIARKLNYVVFDKTGTLTEGKFGITDIVSIGKFDKDAILRWAAAVEYHSQHPIAKGLIEESKKRNIKFEPAKEFKSFPGKGAKGKVGTKEVVVGSGAMLEESGLKVEEMKGLIKPLIEAGKTFIWVAVEKRAVGAIGLEDKIRIESGEAIQSLHNMGIKTAMLTGDTEAIAQSVARKLGIDTYFAQVLPKDKVDKIKQLQKEGNIVAMVGDGVNDAASLTQAHVGIAIGAGTDVAIESAEVVLVKDDPRDVVKAIDLSRKTNRKMVQNLVWAAGYNIIAIPVAAGVLATYGILLRPEWSALIMSASSVIVVANALLLRREKL